MDTNKTLLGVLALVTGVLVIYPKPTRQPVTYVPAPIPMQRPVTQVKAQKPVAKAAVAPSRKIPTVLPQKIQRPVAMASKGVSRVSHRKPASVSAKSFRYGKSRGSLARAR